MRNFVYSSLFFFGFTQSVFSASLDTYEVNEAMKDKHEVEFYNKSAQYEDALRELQIVLVVDKSGSQQAPDQHPLKENPGKGMFGSTWTQWDNTFYAAKYLAESLFEYDSDGKIPVVYFGHSAKDEVASNVGELLVGFKKNKPTNETTNLLDALRVAFSKYANPTTATEKVLFVVLTDGSPNSGQDAQIKTLIRSEITSKKLDQDERLNLLFLRVGDDPGAKAFLQDLDDCAEIGSWVDTKSDNMMYKMGPKNLVLNAIYEHLDGQYKED